MRRGGENDIERDFGSFLQQDEERWFLRVELEDLFEALEPVSNRAGEQQFWEHIQTGTVYFQRAFRWTGRKTAV